MKKSLVLLCLGILFLSSGCTNDATIADTTEMTCTMTENEYDYTTSRTVVISYDNDIVKKFEYTTIFETDEEDIEELMVAAEKYVSDYLEDINGFSFSYSKMNDTSMKIHYTVDYTKLSKEDYYNIVLFDDSFDVTICTSFSDFKADLVDNGFTCK